MTTSFGVRQQWPLGLLCLLLVFGACTSRERGADKADSGAGTDHAVQAVSRTEDTSRSSEWLALADTLASSCPTVGRRGSVLVARVAPEEEETGISFKILGNGAGPGVVLCREVLYADARSLLALMGERGTVSMAKGRAIIDATSTDIPAYIHGDVVYVAVAPFARQRRALFTPSDGHPQDATIFPQVTLVHLKASGNTGAAAYQAAVREGLLKD